MSDNSTRLIVVSISKKEKREGLFKLIDDPKHKDHVIDRSAKKRVISISLFNRLQSHIDAYPWARISLVDQLDDSSYEPVQHATDAKPRSDQYNVILRRLRG